MPEEFEITCERFVAYFDIMKFKDYAYRNTHEKVGEIFENMKFALTSIKSTPPEITSESQDLEKSGHKVSINTVSFSDSIIFYSDSNSHDDAVNISQTACYFLFHCIANQIPIKGALSYGLFTADKNSEIFYGLPLIDAYLLSEDIYFYGVVLHHTFESFVDINQINENWRNLILRKDVPLKGGLINHYYIEPFFPKTTAAERNTIYEKLYRTVYGSTRKYVDNTITVYSPPTEKNP